MLDIHRIRDDHEAVKANLERRRDPDVIELLEQARATDRRWRDALKEVEQLRAERNRAAEAIAETKKAGGDAEEAIQRSKDLSAQLEEKEEELERVAAERDRQLTRLPNLMHESVPFGEDDSDNEVVREWGDPRPADDSLVTHAELLETLGQADFERARKVAGAGFVYLMADMVRLDMALQNYAMDVLVERGYTPVQPPFMMRREPYEGVTDLADFESVMYKVEDDDLYLIATSEHPIGAMFQDEIIDEAHLPLKLAGISACFRREIGAHGIDTKGLFRMHQFNKIEQFVFCDPEDSWELHEELLANAEHIFQKLELPYRVVNVCTGDLGTVAAKKYDIEAWSPRGGEYREVVSCSNCTGYQARRLNIRGGKHGGDKQTVHTLNSTAIATSRALVAILENNQTDDGTVAVPRVLQDYMGGTEEIGVREHP